MIVIGDTHEPPLYLIIRRSSSSLSSSNPAPAAVKVSSGYVRGLIISSSSALRSSS